MDYSVSEGQAEAHLPGHSTLSEVPKPVLTLVKDNARRLQ